MAKAQMAPCAIYIQCRRSGPGEWEDPTLRVDVARLGTVSTWFTMAGSMLPVFLVERIPDLVAAILAIGDYHDRKDHYLYWG